MTLHGNRARRLRAAALGFGLTILLTGCHHKTMPPRLPAVLLTPDVPPTVPDSPTMKSPPPASVSTTSSVKVTQAKPKRPSKKTTVKAPPPETPAETATVAAVLPDTSPVGELTTGGVASPQAQQEAADLIASSERRVEDLSKIANAQQQTQLRKVTYFIHQAKQALATGDVDGAKTLATKAKLLMDDLNR